MKEKFIKRFLYVFRKVSPVLCPIVTGVIAYFVIVTIFHPYIVSGTSMEPTLSDGQVVLSSSVSDVSQLTYGDIVIVKVGIHRFFIKRVIALPGDVIEFKNGQPYVNGKLSDYCYELIEDYGELTYPLTLGDDEYFVLGDNRNNSNDSRSIGTINIKKIAYKVYKVL